MKVTIIGAGSFGSAVAELAARCGHEVLLWAHDPRVAEAINETRSNPFYLSSVKFSSQIHATSSLEEAARFCDNFVMVTPSHHYRSVLRSLAPHMSATVNVISATKGIENDSLSTMSALTAHELGGQLGHFAAFSGPTFALEISRGDPSAAVIAASDPSFAEAVQRELSCDSLRLYRSEDVIGVEVAGALKNVVAIAAGVVEGIGFGWNTTAALITRGLHEIRKLGTALGGRPETFAGLAGMGDLILTCTGNLSRNRRVGVLLGQGKVLEEILSESRLVAEGVRTCRSARDLAQKHSIEMPIISEMYRLLYENETPRNAIHRLMTRSLKPEV